MHLGRHVESFVLDINLGAELLGHLASGGINNFSRMVYTAPAMDENSGCSTALPKLATVRFFLFQPFWWGTALSH